MNFCRPRIKVELIDRKKDKVSTMHQRQSGDGTFSKRIKKYGCDFFTKPKFMINHEGRFKVLWDWLVLLLVIFTAIQVPFYAAFTKTAPVIFDYNKGHVSKTLIILTTLVDFIFIFDIFLNFRTTYIRPSSEVKEDRPKEVAKHYLKTWFVIDLLAAIPFDWLVHNHQDSVNSHASTVIGLLKSARLLRLFRVARKLDRYSEYGVAVLFLLMCFFVLFAHWLACLWNFISTTEEHLPDSWVRRLNDDLHPLPAPVTCLCNKVLDNITNNTFKTNTTEPPMIQLGIDERYIASLYFIVSSLTSVGFGNIAATTMHEQIFSVVVMMLGALMYACIFGNMVAIVQRLYSRATHYHNNMNNVREFLRFYKIPHEIQNNIHNYIRREWLFSPGVDTTSMLQNFPECLQADLTYELYQKALFSNAAFREATFSCMRALSLKFKTMNLQSNLCILRRGDRINKFYLVRKGQIEVLSKDSNKEDNTRFIEENQTFGYDMRQMPRRPKSRANVQTTKLTEIIYIQKDDLVEIFETYPKFAQSFRRVYMHVIDLNDTDEEGYFTTPVRKQKTQNLFARQAAPLIHKVSRQWSKSKKSHTFSEVKVRSENCLLHPKYSLKLDYLEPEPNLSMSNDELSTARQPKTSLDAFKKRTLHQTMSDTTPMERRRGGEGTGSTTNIQLTSFIPRLEQRDTYQQPSPQTEKLDIESRVTRLENKLEKIATTNEQKLNSILSILTELKMAQQVQKHQHPFYQDSETKCSNCISASYDQIDFNTPSTNHSSQDLAIHRGPLVIDLNNSSSSNNSNNSNNSSINGSSDESEEKKHFLDA